MIKYLRKNILNPFFNYIMNHLGDKPPKLILTVKEKH